MHNLDDLGFTVCNLMCCYFRLIIDGSSEPTCDRKYSKGNYLLYASTFYVYVKDSQFILQVLVRDTIINFDVTICIPFHSSREM